jgi:uncharacterized protein
MDRRLELLSVAAAFLLSAGPAFGLSLEEAKKDGLVGETPSGYLEPVQQRDGDVGKLVQEINSKRRDAYRRIAERNGTELSAVEQIGGKEAIEKAARGVYVKLPSGEWKRKG